MKTLWASLLIVVAVCTFAHARDSAVAVSPDGQTTLIQKDVGDERWAMSVRRSDGLVLGNVFSPSGSSTFLSCTRLISQGGNLTLSCRVSDPCTSPGCSGRWRSVGQAQVPDSFFAAPGDDNPTPQPTSTPRPGGRFDQFLGTWLFDEGGLNEQLTFSFYTSVSGATVLAGTDQFGNVGFVGDAAEIAGQSSPLQWGAGVGNDEVTAVFLFDMTSATTGAGFAQIYDTPSGRRLRGPYAFTLRRLAAAAGEFKSTPESAADALIEQLGKKLAEAAR